MSTGSGKHPQELISALLDGELPAAERAAVEKHLRACADCRALLDDLRTLAASTGSEEVPPVPAELAVRIGRQVRAARVGERRAKLRRPYWLSPLPVGAAATLAAVFFVWFTWYQVGVPPQLGTESAAPIAQAPISEGEVPPSESSTKREAPREVGPSEAEEAEIVDADRMAPPAAERAPSPIARAVSPGAEGAASSVAESAAPQVPSEDGAALSVAERGAQKDFSEDEAAPSAAERLAERDLSDLALMVHEAPGEMSSLPDSTARERSARRRVAAERVAAIEEDAAGASFQLPSKKAEQATAEGGFVEEMERNRQHLPAMAPAVGAVVGGTPIKTLTLFAPGYVAEISEDGQLKLVARKYQCTVSPLHWEADDSSLPDGGLAWRPTRLFELAASPEFMDAAADKRDTAMGNLLESAPSLVDTKERTPSGDIRTIRLDAPADDETRSLTYHTSVDDQESRVAREIGALFERLIRERYRQALENACGPLPEELRPPE